MEPIDIVRQGYAFYAERNFPAIFELLAENKLEEPSNSTLAISDGQIFLRTFQNLFCIGEK